MLTGVLGGEINAILIELTPYFASSLRTPTHKIPSSQSLTSTSLATGKQYIPNLDSSEPSQYEEWTQGSSGAYLGAY